jgi:hypothetical protein
MAKHIFSSKSQIGQNSESPEYRFGRKLSQLFDGPFNGSKRFMICELWLSETRLVTESAFLGILHHPE